MTACYRTALTASTLASTSADRGTLQIETNDVGVITRARFDGSLRPLVGGCIERSILGAKVPSVDTGSASADVPLAFLAR